MISLKRSSLHCEDPIRSRKSAKIDIPYLRGVHLVNGDDELTDTKGESQESVLAGLAILGNTSLELTSTTGDDEDSAIGLGGTGNHVLDEITMTGGIDDLDRETMYEI